MIPSASTDPVEAMEAYEAGLARHLDALERFFGLALRQTEAARAGDADALAAVTAERDLALPALLQEAAALAPLRRLVESLGPPWTSHPAWASAAAARHRIDECITRVLAQDDLTRASLHEDQQRRHQEKQDLEAASATLVAYRRTVEPTSRPALLLDNRG